MPRSLRRAFITPEGVDLRLELGSAGSRAAAFMIDLVLMVIILVAMTFAMIYLFSASGAGGAKGSEQFLAVLWLIGFFVLRNGWFALFEMGSRGATPGKRLLGLRVVLRNENPDAVTTVARTIRSKANLPDDGDDYGFLADYYAALCAHLEAGLMLGRRRDNKFSR